MSFKSLEFSSESGNLASVRAFVRDFLKAEGVPVQDGELMVLGVDEACSNIIRHAYQNEPSQTISLECQRDGETLRFRLCDWGIPVDLSRFKRRAIHEVEPGGLGLHLIERVFDEAVYRPQPQGTELLLIKRLNGSEAMPSKKEEAGT